jgi:spoIIIJ-associated protein
MQEPAVAESQIAGFLRSIVYATRLDLTFTIQQHPGSVPDLTIEFTGPDTKYLTARNAELLKAIEHLAAKVRGLEPDQHNLLSCDADRYKKNRDHALLTSAQRAAVHVRETGLPFTFPPMSSHERRQLHLILTPMGLETASTGEGHERRVILYPPALACT